MAKKLFTSESVTEGHPDKLCDQIADAILDAIFTLDPDARVACECSATTGVVFVFGEISTSCYIDIPRVVRNTIREIGYDNPSFGFDANNCAVITSIDEQSPDIAAGVDKALEAREGTISDDLTTGAGDQGLMFGYATNETDVLMPLPITLAHRLAFRLAQVRKNGTLPYLRPDGKTQVSIQYEDEVAVHVDTIIVSTQHAPEISQETIRSDVIEHVIKAVIPENLIDDKTVIYINPTGLFVKGGPSADSGLTGRKIIVDTYGGSARHGGGSFSGKDPTKVDRSASYMARHVAKNMVAAGLADKCEIQFSYAIGVASPTSVYVNSYGTGKLSDEELADIIYKEFDLRPEAIIRYLDLRKPIYLKTAAYGHFGRTDIEVPWEKLNKVEALSKYLVKK
jgi:S-adenosylmethionine synthetase